MKKCTIQINCTNPTRYSFLFENKKSLSKRQRDYKDRISKLLIILGAMQYNIYSDEAVKLLHGKIPYNWVTSSISKSGSQLDPDGEMILINGSGDSTIFQEWLADHQLPYEVFVYEV